MILLSPRDARKNPDLRVNRYDVVTAALAAAMILLGLSVLCVAIFWATNRQPTSAAVPPPPPTVSQLFVAGMPAVAAKMDVESPETQEPSASEASPVTNLDAVLATIESTTNGLSDSLEGDSDEDGKITGTPLGPNEKGGSTARNWLVQFNKGSSINQYARQLDFFQIEIAVLQQARLTYLSGVSSKNSTTREIIDGSNENRLSFSWNNGQRRTADIELFKRSGIDASNGMIFHFYPHELEAQLETLEVEAAQAQNRTQAEILRTYFNIVPDSNGYRFVVTRQLFKR